MEYFYSSHKDNFTDFLFSKLTDYLFMDSKILFLLLKILNTFQTCLNYVCTKTFQYCNINKLILCMHQARNTK